MITTGNFCWIKFYLWRCYCRVLSESYKSPFYKYYDEWKWENLPSIDFTKVFQANDVLHQSAAELIRWGWNYNKSDRTWSFWSKQDTAAKGAKEPNKVRPPSLADDQTLDVFEREFWKSVEEWIYESEDQSDNSFQKDIDDPNYIRTG